MPPVARFPANDAGRREPAVVRPRRVGLIGPHPERGEAGRWFAGLREALMQRPEVEATTVLLAGRTPESAAGALAAAPDRPESYARAANLLAFHAVETAFVALDPHDADPFEGQRIANLVGALPHPPVVALRHVPTHPGEAERMLVRRLGALAARLLVPCAKAAEIAADTYGVPAARIAVVPHGVPAAPAAASKVAAKARLGLGRSTVALTLCPLTADCGVELMIEAMGRLSARLPDLAYVVATGRPNDPAARSLRDLAGACGVTGRVRIVPLPASPRERAALVAAADVYVAPKLSEACDGCEGLALALGAGVPAVATPFWAAQDWLGEGAGLFARFGCPDALAEATARLVEDGRLARTLGGAGRRVGVRMQLDTIAGTIVAMLGEGADATVARGWA